MLAEKLPITGPCPIDLDAIGFDRTAKVSHCSHCAKSVTILSNMTKAEAREFLREHQGQKMCVSYARDEAGRIRFRAEPEPALVPVTRLRPRPAAAAEPAKAPALARPKASRTAGLVAALGVSAALAACTPHGEAPRDLPTVTAKPTPTPAPRERMVTGEMAVADPARLDEPCDAGKPTPGTAKPEPVPLAGAAIIPPELMVDGEAPVPGPEVLDPPHHAGKPAPGTAKTEPPTAKAIPPEPMIEGELAVPGPGAIDEPARAQPRW